MKITKKFKAEIAHRLISSYSKECQNIHGHSYVFEVELECKELNDEGMVLDFKKLKSYIENIFNSWDHSLMLCKDDPFFTYLKNGINENKIPDTKIIVVPFNPTAENMAQYLFNLIEQKIVGLYNYEERIKVTKVIVWETATGKAEYSEER